MSSAEAADLPKKKKKSNKDYSTTTRVYDSDGYRLRADALIFKDEHKQEVLMVSSRNTPNEWTIPGGGLEPDEDHRDTAVREAMEEAGVVADVWESVGVYDDASRKTRTSVFTLLARGEAPNWKDNKEIMRQRHWINTETAISSLKQRDRPLKSKYLKDAYELQTQAAADQGRSETVQASNGHTKRIGNRDTGISSDSRDGTDSETLCVACHDGGCLRNSV